MRKLASIQRIDELVPIEGSDLIQLAKIQGWQCVVKKSEFQVGDLCVYFEIDSFLPIRPEFEHLRKNSLKKMNGEEGFRIKTIKLRGNLSQGLALPIHPDLVTEWSHTFLNFDGFRPLQVGDDVTDILGVLKYEAPVPTELAGQVTGNFPTFIPKTDQERCQNLGIDIFVKNAGLLYEVTTKLDGTSFTGFRKDDEVGVCGRNWQLKVNEENTGNSLVRMFVDSRLQDVLQRYNINLAIQGELMGPGIQRNRENLPVHRLYIFDMYDIDNAAYVIPESRHKILEELYDLGLDKNMVHHVPVRHKSTW